MVVEICGCLFVVLVDVIIDIIGVEGVLFKYGGVYGGYVLFVWDGCLYYVYNFFGEC